MGEAPSWPCSGWRASEPVSPETGALDLRQCCTSARGVDRGSSATKIVPPGLLRKAVREEIGVAALMVEPTKQCYQKWRVD
jgi:hypothetical protein